MQKIHDGDCGNHAWVHLSLTKSSIRCIIGLKMFDDANEYVKKCPQCEIFDPSNRLSRDLHTLQSLAFYAVGARCCGSYSPSTISFQIPTDGMEYFTKWVEAVLLFDITGQQIVKFL